MLRPCYLSCKACLLVSSLLHQVILLPSFGLSAPSVPLAPLQPLKLTHPRAVAVHLAAESAQYWRGLELLAQAPLLQLCPSLDVVLNADKDHQGAVTMDLIQVGTAGRCADQVLRQGVC
jgi:hypothetical protein